MTDPRAARDAVCDQRLEIALEVSAWNNTIQPKRGIPGEQNVTGQLIKQGLEFAQVRRILLSRR